MTVAVLRAFRMKIKSIGQAKSPGKKDLRYNRHTILCLCFSDGILVIVFVKVLNFMYVRMKRMTLKLKAVRLLQQTSEVGLLIRN